MAFTIDPDFGAAVAALGPAPPPLAVGDVAGRREKNAAFLELLQSRAPNFEDVTTKDFHTTAEDGYSILLRWFTKIGSAPGSAVVYAHGGGMISLSISHFDKKIKSHVSQSGVPFLAVEYRLAPEVKAPVPVTDTLAGLKWLHEHAAELGVDTSRIGIMGDSAGGGITASLAHYVKLNGGPAIKKQILIYPMLDDRTLKDDPLIKHFLVWSRDDNETGWRALLGDKLGADNVSVTEAPGRMTVEEAKGLPPAYIDVGELDLFRREDQQYAMTLGQAGVSCELHVVPGMPHAFEGLTSQSEITKGVAAARSRFIKSI